jgi:hypothetical protein
LEGRWGLEAGVLYRSGDFEICFGENLKGVWLAGELDGGTRGMERENGRCAENGLERIDFIIDVMERDWEKRRVVE